MTAALSGLNYVPCQNGLLGTAGASKEHSHKRYPLQRIRNAMSQMPRHYRPPSYVRKHKP